MSTKLIETPNNTEEEIICQHTKYIYKLIQKSQTLLSKITGKKEIKFEENIGSKLFQYNITFSHHTHPGTYTPWNITIKFNEVIKNSTHDHFELSFDEQGNLVKYISYQNAGSTNSDKLITNRVVFPSNDLTYAQSIAPMSIALEELATHLPTIRKEVDVIVLEQMVRNDSRNGVQKTSFSGF